MVFTKSTNTRRGEKITTLDEHDASNFEHVSFLFFLSFFPRSKTLQMLSDRLKVMGYKLYGQVTIIFPLSLPSSDPSLIFIWMYDYVYK